MIVFEYELDPDWPRATTVGRVGTLRGRTLDLQYSEGTLDNPELWAELVESRAVDRVVGPGLQPVDERIVVGQTLIEVLELPDPVDFVWELLGFNAQSVLSMMDLLDSASSIDPNPMTHQLAERFGVPRSRYEIDGVLELIMNLGRMNPPKITTPLSLRDAALNTHPLDALIVEAARGFGRVR